MSDIRPVALFDMDGTLADFNGALAGEMAKVASPFEPATSYKDHNQDTETSWQRARRRMIKNQPGFWRNLPLLGLGMRLLQTAVDAGFRIVIFTKAPLRQPSAFTEKAEWCEKHLSYIDYDLSLVTDKGLHYGKVLVDDWPPYIEAWLKHRPRGQVFMPAHEYNKEFKHPQVIRVPDFSVEEVQSMMRNIAASHGAEKRVET